MLIRIAKIIPPATYPAIKSSRRIPKPPFTFLSTQEIGQGFKISNNLNNKKAKKYKIASWAIKVRATSIPATSSITIKELSLDSLSWSALIHTNHEHKIKDGTIV